MFFIKVLLNLPDFIYCTNYFPIVDWDNTLGLPINLFIFDLAYFIGTSLILWSNLSYKKLLLIFLNQKWLYICFFISGHTPIHHFCWMLCYRHWFVICFHSYYLCCLDLLYQAISLTWVIVPGSKWSSILILLRCKYYDLSHWWRI